MSRRTGTVLDRAVADAYGWPDDGRRRVRLAAAVLTAGPVLLATGVRVAGSAPATAGSVSTRLLEAATVAGLVGPSLAALVVALTSERALERVGLLSVGVFGLLSAAVPAATVPAPGAVTGGGALAVAAGDWRRDWWSGRRLLVAAAVLTAVALSMGSAVGVAPAFARGLGSKLFLLGLASTVVYVRPGTLGWLAGGTVGAATLLAGSHAPFVTGAVVLVAGGVVNASLLAIAVGLGGGVAALVGALESGRVVGALGAAAVLAAGVPATPLRAVAVVVGLALLVDATTREREVSTHE